MPPTTMYNFYGLTTRRLYDGSTTGGYMQRERERESVHCIDVRLERNPRRPLRSLRVYRRLPTAV